MMISSCATKRVTEAAHAVVAADASVAVKTAAGAEEGSGGNSGTLTTTAPMMVRGPDGRARVLVTQEAISLQRQPPDGPREVLDEPMDANAPQQEDKLKELTEGVRWSPGGTRVCLLRLYKRGRGVAVFSLASQPATEVELDLNELQGMTMEHYGERFRHGRFYYFKLLRWIDEDHLDVAFSGNLVPKEDDDGTNWKWYSGTVRVVLGEKTGKMQGVPKWEELTD
ncbi:hypothetical protein [Prosthecobacter sp.]|uniref:hypothetical protein n=1 Tax=Prosthecobacter sp. TaxID=1965333 RepID=UPI00378361D8